MSGAAPRLLRVTPVSRRRHPGAACGWRRHRGMCYGESVGFTVRVEIVAQAEEGVLTMRDQLCGSQAPMPRTFARPRAVRRVRKD